MDITLLPEEIFIYIAKFLSGEDLLSCSLVNFSWRNAVNHNEVWQYVCKSLPYSETGEELVHMKSLATNCSEYEPYSAHGFEPLCKWRKTFMRWIKLTNNWRKGIYKRFKVGECFCNFCSVESDGNVLLIIFDDIREVSVWDINNIPFHRENIQFCLTHVRSEFVSLCNNYLIIVQCNLMLVFYITDKGFQLQYRCLFDQAESHSLKLPGDYDITHWYSTNVGLYPCDLTLQCEQNGDKFVGTVLHDDYHRTLLHFWDLGKKNKIVEVMIPQISGMIIGIHFSFQEDFLYVLVTSFEDSKHSDTVLLFDVNCCKFLEFKLNFNCSVSVFFFYETFLFTVDETWRSVNVWKLNDHYNKKVECDFFIEPKCLNVEGSHLLVCGKRESLYSLTTISVYNIPDLKCQFTIDVNQNVDFITLIQNMFLLVSEYSRRYLCSVYNIITKSHLYSIENYECVCVNFTHTKLITRNDNELNIISFW